MATGIDDTAGPGVRACAVCDTPVGLMIASPLSRFTTRWTPNGACAERLGEQYRCAHHEQEALHG